MDTCNSPAPLTVHFGAVHPRARTIGFPFGALILLGSLGFLLWLGFWSASQSADFAMLQPATFAHHIERCNSMDDEAVVNVIGNTEAWDWLQQNINSYMFANARAIAEIAHLADDPQIADEFTAKAAALKRVTQESLWDPNARFFKVRCEDGGISDAREAIGFVPWMFSLPDPNRGYEAAWAQLKDPQGFAAPYGLTTAERRHPQFRAHGWGKCEWDGAVWPFATSQTLVALADGKVIARADRVERLTGKLP
jgi:hypothetical protein